MRLGVPYQDAWNMPIPMALEFVTVATQRTNSNAKSNTSTEQTITPQINVAKPETGTKKQVATRRKSKQVKDEQ